MDHKGCSLTPRFVRESQTEMCELVLPIDANHRGTLLGGRLMHWIDVVGGMAAFRHLRNHVVTASVDHMDFLTSANVGDAIVLCSSVNRVFRTSMEVGVKVWVDNYVNDTRRHMSSAYLTYVAIDKQGQCQPVPPVVPETADEIRRYEDAGYRRELRRANAQRKQNLVSAAAAK